MTNNTLKSTIESIIATNALIVVTLDGTFNSQTGAPVLSARTRPDQRNKFLADYCEKVTGDVAKEVADALRERIQFAIDAATASLEVNAFDDAIASIKEAKDATEQLDQPRVYYRVKPNVDLRTVAEKRAAKKAENAAKREEKAATKAAKAAEKMVAKVESATQTPAAEPEPVAETHSAKPNKSAKKAA
jgi:uncharacterized protein YqgV (UPF0045/DUF77 family)